MLIKMDNDLLEQEESFHKLNAELELRTRQIIKDVETVINKKNFTDYRGEFLKDYRNEFSNAYDDEKNHLNSDQWMNDLLYNERNTSKTYLLSNANHYERDADLNKFYKKEYEDESSYLKNCTYRRRQPQFSQRPSSVGDDVIPSVAKGMGSESLIKFLKTKVKMLQTELASVQQGYSKKCDDFRHLQLECKQSDEDKKRAQDELHPLREKLRKQELISASLNDKLQLKESEIILFKKEVSSLKQEIKKIGKSSSSSDMKLNKAKEDLEKLKLTIKLQQDNEKEIRSEHRMENDKLHNHIKKLEKIKTELIYAFKKQSQLIDNLKRQKTSLEMDQALKYSEEEFMKLLEWSPEKE